MEVLSSRENPEEVQSHLQMSDGFEIFYRRWQVVGETKCVLVLLHGAQGHSGSYVRFAHELASKGVEVLAPDQRGVANSKENGLARGDTSSKPDRWLKDLDEIVAFARTNHPGKKVFLMGHSRGANLLLWYSAQRPDFADGLILAAPGVKNPANFNVGAFVLKLVFTRVFAPKRMINFFDYMLTEEEKRAETFKMFGEDPLWTPNASARVLFRSYPLTKPLQHAARITKPTLIIQGDADPWSLPEGSKQLFERLVVTEKTLKMFPGADHLFYGSFLPRPASNENAEKREEVAVEVSGWLEAN